MSGCESCWTIGMVTRFLGLLITLKCLRLAFSSKEKEDDYDQTMFSTSPVDCARFPITPRGLGLSSWLDFERL